MSNKVKFASLTAGLLARKGEAEPSATPFAEQLLTRVGAPAVDMRPMMQNGPERPQPTHFSPPVFGRRTPEELLHLHHREPDQLRHPEPEHHEEPVEVAPPAPVQLMTPTLVHSADAYHHETPLEPRCGACPGPSPEDATKTYHVNLRLKRTRFVRLKLTSALMRKPVQEIVNEALDAWFETVPTDVLGDCACLNARGD
ncbi:MAG: hypothetical protein GC190_15735 [Alphaproteobacteria bacterium]|nr:hypothetical protein [Alphaproteobacteria bacterium]